MQLFFQIVLFIFLFDLSFCQPLSVEWQKSFGGSGNDMPSSCIQTIDGGFIVSGQSNSVDGDVVGNHGGIDAWILKLDASGNKLWSKCIGGTGDEILSIEQINNREYVVSGHTTSNDGDVSGNHGSNDFWVLKLDTAGTILWQKCFGGSGIDYGSFHQFNGKYFIVGTTASNDGDVSGNHGGEDVWIVKLDTSRNIIWQKCLGGSGTDKASSIQQTNDGNFIVCGSSSSNNGDVSGNHGGEDIWIVKLDTSGNILWQKCLGGSNDESGTIQQINDGGFIVIGASKSNDGNLTSNFGLYDYWVVKLDSSGTIMWQKSFGGSADDIAGRIIQTLDNGYIIGGATGSVDGNVIRNMVADDFWIIKLDSSGTMQWQQCFHHTTDFLMDMKQTSDAGFIFTGWTGRIPTGPIAAASFDYWVVKTGAAVGVKNSIFQSLDFSVYPNPFTDEIRINFHSEKEENIKLQIFNSTGQPIKILNAKDLEQGNNNLLFSLQNVPRGIYFIKSTIGGLSGYKKVTKL